MSQSPSRRFEKLALFTDLGYTPHPGQLLVHRSKARRRVMACGARFGKSTCASMEGVAALCEPRAAALGWLVAPTYDLADRVMRRVIAVLESKLSHRILEYAPREQRIVVANVGGGRSELRAKSADQPVSLLGEALDFLIVDEAARLRREVWEEMLSPRLIDRKGWFVLLSTPQGPGWFHEEFRRGQRNRDPESESWASPSRDNPHVDASVIEAERARIPPDAFAQQYEAKFIGVEKEPCEVCGGWDPEANWGIITLLPGETELTCAACGEFVDEDGHTIYSGQGLVPLINELKPDEVEAIAEERAQRAWRARNRELKKAGLPPEPPLPRKPGWWG